MTFQDVLDATDLDSWRERSACASPLEVRAALADQGGVATLDAAMARFAALISPAGREHLEELARHAHGTTVLRFGRVLQLYAPLYVSNECIDTCTYCGFTRESTIHRVTLTVERAAREAETLHAEGFRHVLLVSGEHPRIVSTGYLADVVRRLRPNFASIAIEVAPQYEQGYRELVDAGVDGVVVYQETYDRDVYAQVHTAGRKKNFDWRLATPERAARAGARRIGIGALLGLADWRRDALATFLHAGWLQRHCWRSQITVSVPRLRRAHDAIAAPHPVGDAELAQLVCALRVCLPDVGLVLSTRERPGLRDGLVRLGITQLSAGSRTEPGGYNERDAESEQFEIADERSPAQVVARLRELGFAAVWKDWEATLHGAG